MKTTTTRDSLVDEGNDLQVPLQQVPDISSVPTDQLEFQLQDLSALLRSPRPSPAQLQSKGMEGFGSMDREEEYTHSISNSKSNNYHSYNGDNDNYNNDDNGDGDGDDYDGNGGGGDVMYSRASKVRSRATEGRRLSFSGSGMLRGNSRSGAMTARESNKTSSSSSSGRGQRELWSRAGGSSGSGSNGSNSSDGSGTQTARDRETRQASRTDRGRDDIEGDYTHSLQQHQQPISRTSNRDISGIHGSRGHGYDGRQLPRVARVLDKNSSKVLQKYYKTGQLGLRTPLSSRHGHTNIRPAFDQLKLEMDGIPTGIGANDITFGSDAAAGGGGGGVLRNVSSSAVKGGSPLKAKLHGLSKAAIATPVKNWVKKPNFTRGNAGNAGNFKSVQSLQPQSLVPVAGLVNSLEHLTPLPRYFPSFKEVSRSDS